MEENSHTIDLPDAPAIPGLSFRAFRGPADFPGMVAVHDACRPVDGYEHPVSTADLARHFSHLERCEPRRDMIVAEVGGEIVGYGRGEWHEEPDGTRLHDLTGHVAPAWRRRGIGHAILRWTEERQREVAAATPAAVPRFFQVDTQDSERGMPELLTGAGYRIVRRWYKMTRPLDEEPPEAPLPPGLEVRPVTPDLYRRVWEADTEAFRGSWGFREPSEDDYREWLEEPLAMQAALWQVAWEGEEVAGQVRSYIDAAENAGLGLRRGYTESISVRPRWRRHGLAYALIMRSLRVLRERGMTEAALYVDTENLSGALRLYERCGYRPLRSGSNYRKPLAAAAQE